MEQDNRFFFKVRVTSFGEPQQQMDRVLEELRRSLKLTFGDTVAVWAINDIPQMLPKQYEGQQTLDLETPNGSH